MNKVITATNNLEVKNTNKRRVINLLYQQSGMTKQDIARSLELSIPTVSQILKELTERGLMTTAGHLKSTGGRKPMLNALVHDAKFAVGIEITPHHIRFVLINLAGTMMAHEYIREKFEHSPEYTQRLSKLCDDFISKNQMQSDKILGIGIAVPGIVQVEKDVIEYLPTLNVKDFPISNLRKYFNIDIKLENEANLAGLAEIWCRHYMNDAVFLSIKKGVGGAVIINNQVYAGKNFRAGEFGHMTIVENGKTCACGKKGCLEAYCSTKVLREEYNDDLSEFFTRLNNKDEACIKIWDEYLNHLATGINNLRMVFDAEVIIGGEIHQFCPTLRDQLNQKLNQLDSFNNTTNYLHISKHGVMASAMGAALLRVDEFLNE
jgi:predicted NBD/HSP70 family sugar kinase/DNA-binding XRE family transcriptional regulator